MIFSHCVLVPFLNRHEQVARCVSALVQQAASDTLLLLVDDGSFPLAQDNLQLQTWLQMPNVHLIRHETNQGVSAARNSGLHWCRQRDVEIVIMIDSDCFPEPNVIAEHLRLHSAHPDAVCIGGQIAGFGEGIWAELDGITSWIHAESHGQETDQGGFEFRAVKHPYHLATTNFSVKLKMLPCRDFIFDERLKTGEDCLLIRELRRGAMHNNVFFSGTPTVHHQDRERFSDVFRHHYAWGHHQYFIQLGGDISPRCFNLFYRVAFVCLFLPLAPWFALIGTLLNSKALLKLHRQRLYFLPLIYLLWLGKSIAVLEAALRPAACLRAARSTVHYVAVHSVDVTRAAHPAT